MGRGSPGRSGGYAVVELTVVLALLAVILCIAVVGLVSLVDRSRQRATMADMRAVAKGIEAYAASRGFLPDDASGSAGLRAALGSLGGRPVPTSDRWRHPFRYRRDGAGNYTLASLGKDGVDGDDISVATRDDYFRDIVLVNGRFTAAPE